MDTMFMNSKNSKISDLHRLLLNLLNNIDLKRRDKYAALSNLSIYYTWKNIHEELELPVRSYSVSDIQDYFQYIFKKHGDKTDNPSIRLYLNKI